VLQPRSMPSSGLSRYSLSCDRRADVHPPVDEEPAPHFALLPRWPHATASPDQHGHECRLRDGHPAGRHPCPGGDRFVRPTRHIRAAHRHAELPEVETVRPVSFRDWSGRASFASSSADATFGCPAGQVCAACRGPSRAGIDRRAKYLLVRLDDGHTLIAHLGMSGRMTLHDAASAAEHPFERHDHVVIDTEEGWQVRFNDARRFGLMLLAADEALPKHKLFRAWAPSRSTTPSTAPPWRTVSREDARPSSGTARSEDPGRRRQYLRLRGAVPGRDLAPRRPTPSRRTRRPAGRRHQAGAATSIDDGGSTLRDHVHRAASWAIFRRASTSTTAKARFARLAAAARSCAASCIRRSTFSQPTG